MDIIVGLIVQALEAIDDIGDKLKIKFSRMRAPQFSENDADFRLR